MQTVSIELGALPTLASSTARLPDVLVLDIRDGGEMPQVVAEIRRLHPSTGVVIVGSALDPTMLLAAMRAGVNELVTDPVTKDNLEAAIARVLGQRPGSENGQVFAVVGAKGGVGATTVAVNVATTLGSIGGPKSTLLIDL